MPGILAKSITSEHSTIEFKEAKKRLVYSEDQISNPTLKDDLIIATSVPTPLISSQSYLADKNIHVWVNGENYGEEKELTNLLLNGYTRDRLKETLHDIDGYYSALIYDPINKEVISITDRYGFKPMYIYIDNGNVIIASELKCIASFSDTELTIDAKALECFIQHGQMIENSTWFTQVKVQGAATMQSIDLKTKQSTSQSYWSWNEIVRNHDSFDRAIDHTHYLLENAIKNRIGAQSISIALSGGLDSRTILALCDPKKIDFTYTFGKQGSEDVLIAKKLSQQDKVEHNHLRINDNNWYHQRVEGIWKTDGMCSMMHMHASQFHSDLAVRNTIHLNGYAGDLVLGGSWIDNETTSLNSLNESTELDQNYLNPNITDSYFIDSRVRRFTHAGISEATRLLPHRLPFFDNDLIEYVYSLPEGYRKDNKIYLAIYKKIIDPKYSKVKYQKTGAPLFTSFFTYYRGQQKIKRGLSSLGLIQDGQYAAYPKWFRQQNDKIQKILLHPDALYKNYVDINFKSIFDTSSLDIETISRILTIEIWLQQIVKNRLLTTQEVFSS